MEAAAELIANPAAGHACQRLVDDLSLPGESPFGVVPTGQQELNGGRMRELGRGAEAAVAHIEEPSHLIGGRGEQALVGDSGSSFVQCLADVLANRARVRGDALALFSKGASDLHQHAPESRTAVLIVVGGEIRAAKEDFPVGREERRERPAALATQRLHGALVASIHVRPFIAVDLDAHEVAIEDLRDARVLVRLTVHDVAPMAPDSTDVEQDRLVLAVRTGESGFPPREPMDGLVRGGFEVGGCFGGQRVQLKYLTAVRVNSSAPRTSDSSSMSNVGLWCGETAPPLFAAEPTNAKQPGTFSRK